MQEILLSCLLYYYNIYYLKPTLLLAGVIKLHILFYFNFKLISLFCYHCFYWARFRFSAAESWIIKLSSCTFMKIHKIYYIFLNVFLSVESVFGSHSSTIFVIKIYAQTRKWNIIISTVRALHIWGLTSVDMS